LLPSIQTRPADYLPGEVWTLEDDREATIEDVCQFIVEYINSDVMVRIYIVIYLRTTAVALHKLQGLLADRHMIIADQSKVSSYSPCGISILTPTARMVCLTIAV
jgi:RNA-dependent RNA polymerase